MGEKTIFWYRSKEGKSHLSESIVKSLGQAVVISEKRNRVGNRTRYCPICGEELREAEFSSATSWVNYYGMVCDNCSYMWSDEECTDCGEVVVFYDEFLKRNGE